MKKKLKWNLTEERMDQYIATLTDSLPMLRARVGVSQGNLATIIGVSRQTYSAIEGKRRKMSWSTFLALILFFDYDSSTHLFIRKNHIFPDEMVEIFSEEKENPYFSSIGITGIPSDVSDRLDAQALHTIRTLVMIEYARCTNQTGEDVVKAFDGKVFTDSATFTNNTEISRSLDNIKKKRTRKNK